MTDWLLIGVIVGVHGIKGEIKVQPETDFPERLAQKGKLRRLVMRDGHEQEVTILSGRPHKTMYLLFLAGVSDRNQAERLIGGQLYVSETERPALDTGEFWVNDLIGLTVRRQDTGETIGQVKGVTATGVQQLLTITTVQGVEVLVPFVEALVPVVNLPEGWLSVVPLPGLLEADSADSPLP